tara:strand:+ start:27540 stop:28916 length:1377 start_codon:yes stop_codon:yes gene_type:complete
MPTINDRIGSQNAIRVLSNASAPPTRIVNLTDINASRKGESGLTLVWNHNAEEFFLTDSFNAPGGYTYSVGIVTFANQIESTSASTGGVLFQGGVGITSNLYIGGSSGITSNFSVVGITTLASNGGITTTGGDLYIGGQLYSGDSTIGSDGISVSGIVTANSVSIGATQVLSDAFQLQNIASLDTTTTATIEAAVSAAPNTFTNLDITGISTFQEAAGFVGVATFGGGIAVQSGVSTFSDNTQFNNGVLVSAGATIATGGNITVGDDVRINIGDASDLVIRHDSTEGHSSIDEQGTGSLIIKSGGSPKITINSVGSATTINSDLIVLGVGTFHALGVTTITAASASFTGNVTIGGTLTYEDVKNVDSIGLITARSGVRILDGGLNVTAGVSTFAAAIDANGGLDVSGGTGFIASSAKISDLTSGRVVYAGASGELQDSANLTFDGTELSAGLIDGGSY